MARKKVKAEKPSGQEQGPASQFPIVGIGASAGGYNAIATLLEAMPDEPGVALVIVQHLDPTKKSFAPELLSRCTKMKVMEIDDDPQVKPNTVYVIPPDKYLSISNGVLHLTQPNQPRAARRAIDFFLRALAEDQRQCGVGVILSGTGTDGTLGVKAIKAAGGLVIAQDPNTAEHDGMPRNAISSGAVDRVLRIEAIPEVLIRYAQHRYVQESAAVEQAADGDQAITADDGLHEIISLVRAHTKRDFRDYKRNTLDRRTRRRMCLHHIHEYAEYLDYLRSNSDEIDALASDLLISVTDFFREPEAWEELSRVAIQPMVESKTDSTPIRVWTPGCATGEEPYSMAMLILEELRRAGKSCPLNVFATDIDRDAIDYARAGRYPKCIEVDVSGERLQRFFTAKDDDDYYHVNKMLREAVIFADQDLISDPPFSKLDLICCRNVLIYLKPEVQEKLITLFHFALAKDGVLFLGSAETIGRQTDLFRVLNKRWRIFGRVGPTQHERVQFPVTPTGHRRHNEPVPPPPPRHESRLTHLAQQRLLDILAPSAVLIDRSWRIQYICGDVDDYLMFTPGMPSNNLLDSVRKGLRTKLRGAVHATLSNRETVTVEARVQRHTDYLPVKVTVRLIQDREQKNDLLLVMFEAVDNQSRPTSEPPRPQPPAPAERESVDDAVVRQLEEELADTRSELQAAVEQLEASNEEFRAANEEVMSINEELQSTNEELETSKEELQSLNEELSTVNNQLSAKVDELETKHADLQNLLAVTDVATICLDVDLAVRWFTPAAQQMVRLKPSDRGRPLGDFSHDFTKGDLVDSARQVLDRLTPLEEEVTCHDDRTFIRRISPYRTDDHRIGGVIITFVDISRRKSDERQLQAAKEMSDKIVDTVREGMLVLDGDLRILRVNQSFYDQFHVHPAETEGKRIYELGNGQWDIPELRELLEHVLPTNNVFNDYLVDHKFDSIGRRVMLLNGRRIDSIERILLAVEDITERYDAEQAIRRSEERMRRMINIGGVGVLIFNEQGTLIDANDTMLTMVGFTREEIATGRVSWRTMTPPEYVAVSEQQLAKLAETGRLGPYEKEYLHKDGSRSWMLFAGAHIGDGMIVEYCIDVGDRKRAEAALRESEEQMRMAAAAAHFGSYSYDLETESVKWSPELYAIHNLAPTEVITQSRIEEQIHPEDRPRFRDFIRQALASAEGTDYRGEFRIIRPDGEERWMADHGRVVFAGEGSERRPSRAVGMVIDITERKRAEEALRRLNESLEQQMSQRTTMLRLLQDVTRAANEALTVEEAMRAALQLLSGFGDWKVGHVYRSADDRSGQMVSSDIWYIAQDAREAIGRLAEFQRISKQTRFSPGQGLIGAVMATGQPQWIEDISKYADWKRGNPRKLGLHAVIAFPVTVENRVVAVLEFFSERPATRDERFMEIMPVVGIQLGHVIRRKNLEQAIDTATTEQMRSIGQELHDSVAQQLTGIAMVAEVLLDKLERTSSEHTKTVELLVKSVRQAQNQVRLLSHGLIPVEVDADGLRFALSKLVEDCNSLYPCICHFKSDEIIAVQENDMATHLFRIAQEAIHNAVKHGKPKNIEVALRREDDDLVLEIDDDGTGFRPDWKSTGGSGLHIMQHRASLLGAQLAFASKENGGVRVTCRVRQPLA